jgi:hypothetical protein
LIELVRVRIESARFAAFFVDENGTGLGYATMGLAELNDYERFCRVASKQIGREYRCGAVESARTPREAHRAWLETVDAAFDELREVA